MVSLNCFNNIFLAILVPSGGRYIEKISILSIFKIQSSLSILFFNIDEFDTN